MVHFIALFSFLLPTGWAGVVVNDITQLNPIEVDSVFAPLTIAEVQAKIKNSKGVISIGGGRYSMGGQTATEHAIQIDMRKLNHVVSLDEKTKTITVEAGIRWRDIQEVIDAKNLSIQIMQTYSNFTVGGSLSVNVHGRYVNQGSVIRSVKSIKVVLANGEIVTASPTENKKIFYGVIGGYGALGVIVEATLMLTDNIRIERQVQNLAVEKYREYFLAKIKTDATAVFHNGDFILPEFKQVRSITWVKTEKPVTVTDRLIPKDEKYYVQPVAISAISSLPFGTGIRNSMIDPLTYKNSKVEWRNYEASYDVAELEPLIRYPNTYVLQEYFIPIKNFELFVSKMKTIFDQSKAQIVNVSIRHALADPGSLMAWAREEVFSFVIYYKQGRKKSDADQVAIWTKELIGAATSLDGSYYLPYQILASEEQFKKAYPHSGEFFALKKEMDPTNRFRNKLLDRYYHP